VERSYPLIFLVVFAIMIGGTLLVAGSVSGAAFSTYNPAWDGTSELRSIADDLGLKTTVLRDVSEYPTTDAEGTVVFVLSPDNRYASGERETIREFVTEGGTLVVAENFDPHGNGLLRGVGVETRFDGALVRDEEHFETGPTFPRATNVTDHQYTRDVEELTLNHGTVLRTNGTNATNATTLIRTSSFSYLDVNRNNELDDSETLQEHPVVAVEQIGAGQVIVASDPSVFINAMLDQDGNRQFTRNLLAGHDRAAVDVSHTGGVPLVAWLVLAIRESALAQLLGGLMVVLIITGHRKLGSLTRAALDRVGRDDVEPPTARRETILAALQERHPDWDDQRLRRVTQNLIHREEKHRTDE